MSNLQLRTGPALPQRPLSHPAAGPPSSDSQYATLSDNDDPGSPFDDSTGFGADWVDERSTFGKTSNTTAPANRPWTPSAQRTTASQPSSRYPTSSTTASSHSSSYNSGTTSPRPTTSSIASLTKNFREKASVAARTAAKNAADWHAQASQPGGVLDRAAKTAAEFSVKAKEAASEAATAAREAANNARTKGPIVPARSSYREDEKPANPVFGVPLVDAVSRSQVEMVGRGGYRIEPTDVPAVVYRSIEFMDVYGLEEVGIYRLSGSAKEVAGLKQLFNAGADLDLTSIQIDPHTVSSMFKAFFRELPESILTQNLSSQFSDISASLSAGEDPTNVNAKPDQIKRIASLCLQLPRENYALLAFLCAHLNRVQERQGVNKMGLGNLQVIFSPTLGMSSYLLGVFIMHYAEVLPLPIPTSLKRTERPPPPVVRPRPTSERDEEYSARPVSGSSPSSSGGGRSAFGGGGGGGRSTPSPTSSPSSTLSSKQHRPLSDHQQALWDQAVSGSSKRPEWPPVTAGDGGGSSGSGGVARSRATSSGPFRSFTQSSTDGASTPLMDAADPFSDSAEAGESPPVRRKTIGSGEGSFGAGGAGKRAPPPPPPSMRSRGMSKEQLADFSGFGGA
ncbi:hypothetical protein HDV00_000842 [Rhizophlyctis rosea]|nr:hypothetical protein HDV00_000842 [Rhizophlyctis rosea]